ncbi:thiamine-phosphate kinase [Sphingomonas sp. 1P06PA]|uniref:thiamine-phosphate kinase n=1 Tax=Sphingomonas sp. 1P06PA TaxID=554121 RepID=UPI0039A40A52
MISAEAAFIARLRAAATHPGARGLMDDAAILGDLVLTHDMIVEGVHFLPGDPPATVAHKLVATNLSDLAAKGAEPVGALLGYTLSDSGWDAAFADGLTTALARYRVPLLGGDTVSAPTRCFGLTAIGRAPAGGAPDRRGGQAGDLLFVSGTIGDAGLGLQIARGEMDGPPALLARYRTPEPRLALGSALAPHVSAMCDVSDGLLIDAARIAEASGLAVTIDLDRVPLSADARKLGLDPLDAATAGDDYELLFAAPAPPAGITGIACIGRLAPGTGLTLLRHGQPVPLPASLGHQHD